MHGTRNQAVPNSACTGARRFAFFAALALLFAGAMCGPVGMLTSSPARDQTQPAGFQVATGTDIPTPASAAGAVPSGPESAGGSSTTGTGMGPAEDLATNKKNGSGAALTSLNGGGDPDPDPDPDLDAAKEERREGTCPSCESMFGKLVGKKQHVELQLRGVSRRVYVLCFM